MESVEILLHISHILGGSGSSFAIDETISVVENAGALWMPATNGPDEWLQVDLLYSETVIQVQNQIHAY